MDGSEPAPSQPVLCTSNSTEFLIFFQLPGASRFSDSIPRHSAGHTACSPLIYPIGFLRLLELNYHFQLG